MTAISYVARKVGYIPAKAQPILETLTKRNENVGLVLDGIAGMFTSTYDKSGNVETAFLKQRKGIVKIALKAGAPIVPGMFVLYSVYQFVDDSSRPFIIRSSFAHALDRTLILILPQSMDLVIHPCIPFVWIPLVGWNK